MNFIHLYSGYAKICVNFIWIPNSHLLILVCINVMRE